MSERYDAQAVEAKWQAAWEDAGLFRAERTDGRPTYYVLEMFPYPSGRIHMGHVRNYTMGDVVARYKRARGFDVLHPMGWDAFGLPAENAAFERGVHPAEWTYANIATMRGQLRLMGLSIDWEREFATCHPGYYAHQQALFLDFFEAGLVERKEAWVNWDPVDNTVLANEQVVDGRGWRSGALIEKRRLAQWFFRITRFADELLEALEELPRWPDKVRLMQRNWIGRSEGARILFPIEGRDEALEVFTTRPDTLFGASLLCPLAQSSVGDIARRVRFRARCVHRRVQPGWRRRARHRGGRQARLRYGSQGPASVCRRPHVAALCRQLRAHGLWHRRDIRLSRPRPARSRFRPQPGPARHSRGVPAGHGCGRGRDRR